MPNIDTTVIEGFETMNDSEKLAALLALDIPERVDLSGYVKKDILDKTSSELAAAKKRLKEKMTAEDAAKVESDEKYLTLEQNYNELLKKSTISEHTNKYLALGYTEELAKSTAEAIYNGDMDTVLENQRKYNLAREKALRSDIEKKLHPSGGSCSMTGESEVEKVARELGKRSADSYAYAEEAHRKYLNRR